MPFSKDILAGASGQSGASGFYTHQIEHSLRLENSGANSTATQYLVRDPSAGDRDKWTISMWVKLGRLATSSSHTSMAGWGAHSGSGSGRGYGMIQDYTGNQNGMSFEDNNGSSWHVTTRTNTKLRDTTAWYHLVWVYDSAQGTNSNRAKMYINGVLITSLQSTTYPSQNADHSWFSAGHHFIGTNGTSSDGDNPYQGVEGYIAEVVALDGSAVNPVDNLGEFKQGVWIPKDPSGLTFGSQGFYLKFGDTSNFGLDSSGNGNNFTATGLGADHQEITSPTNGAGG